MAPIRGRRHTRLTLVAVAALGAAFSLAPIADVQAVKPGLNGKIAFDSNRDGNTEIYVMNNDGTGVTRLTDNAAADANPSWSPDSTASARIAFVSARDGNNEIYAMNADGANQTNITNNAAADTMPAWSPDGTKIAFNSKRDVSSGELYTMNADGTSVTRLTNNTASDTRPAWSSDGAKIVFETNRDLGGGGEIYTMNADGANQTRLTNNTSADLYPTWSPDGTKIVFVSDRDGNNEIYSMSTDGSSQTRLSTNGSNDREPVYSPDGAKLALSSDASGGQFDIYGVNADGSGTPTNLTNNPATDANPDVQTEQAPDTTISSGPANPTSATSATFDFGSSEAGSTFTCKLDSGTATSCTSPKTYTGLAGGSHAVEVTAADAIGNPDPTSATYAWTVDTAPPQTTITSGPPHNANTRRATFQFASTEPGSTFQCRLGASDWASCDTPASVEVGDDGSHVYEVRAVDPVGNPDPTPASHTWNVDTGVPDTVIDSGPAEHSGSISATFGFHATESDVAFECRLDGEDFAPCASPEPVSALVPGNHSFQVRATDSSGNVDQSPAGWTWTVDRRAPTVNVARFGDRSPSRHKYLALRRSSLKELTGTAADDIGLLRVKVALRIDGKAAAAEDSCRFISLYTGHRIAHPCKKPYTKVTGTTSWKLRLRNRVVNRLRTNEQYVLMVRATDLAHNNKYTRTRFAVVDG